MQIGKTDTSGIGVVARQSQVAATGQTSTSQTTTSQTATTTGGGTAASLTGTTRTQAPAILTEVPDDGTANLTPSTLAELVAKKTQDYSKTLMAALEAAKIPTDEPITLRVDGAGRVTADGPYKDRIEKMFKENPDLTKQFKDTAALNSMVALNEAMRRFSEAQKKARDDDERNTAQVDYLADCIEIQGRSNTMVLSDGQLSSPAIAYMATR